MIPIRRYPYTDFHDLNLDYLLRQIAEFEEDLEALKRRVKSLEDWRIIVDSDITIIKGDIVTIKGDIVDIKGDIIDIKGDISDIKGDIVTIKNDILDIKGDIITIQGDIVTINRNIDDHSVRIGDLEKNTFAFLLKAQAGVFQPVTNPIYPDYPYFATYSLVLPGAVPEDYEKFRDGDFIVNSKSLVELEFRDAADYFTYGKIISSYAITGNNFITLYAKEVPSDTIYFYCYVINENLNT